jgi:hypothetical protein
MSAILGVFHLGQERAPILDTRVVHLADNPLGPNANGIGCAENSLREIVCFN